MGRIGTVSRSYDVLPLGPTTIADLMYPQPRLGGPTVDAAMIDGFFVERDTDPSPGVPVPEPMPTPYPEPVPEPPPIPAPGSAFALRSTLQRAAR